MEISNIPPDKPPDEAFLRPKRNGKGYADVLKESKSIHKEAAGRLDLNKRWKWETFVLSVENEDGAPYKGSSIKHIDIYDVALKFGFLEHEIAGANPRLGQGQACFYTKFPLDIRERLHDLKKTHVVEIKFLDGSLEKLFFKLKGVDQISVDRKKKFTITLINTFKRIDEQGLVEWIKKFGTITDHYPKKNPHNSEAEEKYKNYRDVWRDSDYAIEITADPSTIPQILPFQGNLVKVKFMGVKLQCQKCFGQGHLKQYCTQRRMKLFDYERTLKKSLAEQDSSVASVEREVNCETDEAEHNYASEPSHQGDCTIVPTSGEQLVARNEELTLETEINNGDSHEKELQEDSLHLEESLADNSNEIAGARSQELSSRPLSLSSDCTNKDVMGKQTSRWLLASSSQDKDRTGVRGILPSEGGEFSAEQQRLQGDISSPEADSTVFNANKKYPSHLDADLILRHRTRSQTVGKRNKPESQDSPDKNDNPAKFPRT